MDINSVFGNALNAVPKDLIPPVSDFINQLVEKITPDEYEILKRKEIQNSLVQVCCCSEFIRDTCLRHPQLLIEQIQTKALFSEQHRDQYSKLIARGSIDNDALLMRHLRLFRAKEMLRIAWRDLAGWSDLNETLKDLTALAEACIQFALNYFYQKACELRGIPTMADGRPINIVVLGMGKLGAWELNYSSDIDLIFAYAEDGVLKDRKKTTYGEFFTRICRSLIKALDETTVDGFVFRTDVRLRPFGDSGPLIMTFDGMENYYMTQAREWERYAMIKARQVAGDYHSGKQLATMIKPFVFRRYLDYGAFEELRNLKYKITLELKRKDRLENIKLGPGGIREIEFIGQAFQLIRGGNEPELQQREILKILLVLEKQNLLDKNDSETLCSGYLFLRRVENHIQQYQDKQTHDLPIEPHVQNILAYSMDYPNWPSFKQELDKVRNQVHQIFNSVFSVSEQKQEQKNSMLIWNGEIDDAQCVACLHEYGFIDGSRTLTIIHDFKQSRSINRLTSKGMATLDRLIPQLIEASCKTENQDETLSRILRLFEAVAGRNVYLSLLAENPDALEQLVKLSAASQWVCEFLAKYPVLFDELLDTRSLYEPLDKQALTQQLKQELTQVALLDIEQSMTKLRQFKHLNTLRVAAADIMGVIPVTVVSDYLTCIAEVVLEQVVDRAWQILIEKHGYPDGNNTSAKGFAILGLGKLGGVELGYGSDLDMVFLYENKDNNAMTTGGGKKISNSQFYLRLGQKIRHILDTKMLSGVLYEADLRLRPSGDSGLLVTHINSYESYMKNEAWTWEHQALVRGRFIAGDIALKQKYEQIRSRILCLPRNHDDLKKEVVEMRKKMRDNLAPKSSKEFSLKQSEGGIADIEFIVQFSILANASENEAITNYTDNARLLDELANHGFISMDNVEFLKNAYFQYRDYGHRLALQGKKAIVDGDQFLETRTRVKQLWDEIFSAPERLLSQS